MICKNCIHFKVCKHKSKSVYECEHFADGTIKNQYDRIRNMSIEEMAVFIQDISGNIERYVPFCQNKAECNDMLDNDEDIPAEMCLECMKIWLESEGDTE